MGRAPDRDAAFLYIGLGYILRYSIDKSNADTDADSKRKSGIVAAKKQT